MATNETYKSKAGDKVTETMWHNVVAWGKTAEIAAKFLKKGSEIMIEGKLVHRNYEDKEGTKRYVTEVHAHELLFLDKKGE